MSHQQEHTYVGVVPYVEPPETVSVTLCPPYDMCNVKSLFIVDFDIIFY